MGKLKEFFAYFVPFCGKKDPGLFLAVTSACWQIACVDSSLQD